MTNNDSFLKSLSVDTATLTRINKLPSLLAKRTHYIHEFLPDYLVHLKNEYNSLHMAFPNVDITPSARIKSSSSYYSKAVRVAESTSLKDIHDIFANRYVVNSVNGSFREEDIIPVLYSIKDFLDVVFGDVDNVQDRIKDYIISPKPDSYQALHVTRHHNDNKFYTSETQLRSASMQECAHSGSASHANTYKKRIPGQTSVPQYLEYVFGDDGFCTEVKQMSVEKAFEKFFGIVYDPDLYGKSSSQK